MVNYDQTTLGGKIYFLIYVRNIYLNFRKGYQYHRCWT